jgi:hypothetical protein
MHSLFLPLNVIRAMCVYPPPFIYTNSVWRATSCFVRCLIIFCSTYLYIRLALCVANKQKNERTINESLSPYLSPNPHGLNWTN